MNDEFCDKLSPSGVTRREAMLAELTQSMRRTHLVRRRTRRAVTASVGLLVVLGVVRLSVTGIPRPDPAAIMAQRPDGDRAARAGKRAARACVIVHVDTDVLILDRLCARPSGRVLVLDDPALVATLAQLNRPAGLIRCDGRLTLTAAVTDAELGLKQ